MVCFNYLQQKFILIAATMKSLATGQKGAAAKVIWYLLECTKGTQFELTLDDECVRDLGDILHADYPKGIPGSSETQSDFDTHSMMSIESMRRDPNKDFSE